MRAITALLVYTALIGAAHGAPPQPAAATLPVPPPRDLPYPGTIALAVDASNIAQDIFLVHETIPVTRGASLTLLYPEWRPGNHSPTARSRIGRVAGLMMHGQRCSGGGLVARPGGCIDAFHVTVYRPKVHFAGS